GLPSDRVSLPGRRPRHQLPRVGWRERAHRLEVQGDPDRREELSGHLRPAPGDPVARRGQSLYRGNHGLGRREEDADAAGSRLRAGGLIVKLGAALLALGLLAGAPVHAQEPDKTESDARRAFDAGRFQEAAEKFAKAAEAPDLSADRKSELYFQSAWAYFIGGNSKASRENLKAAFTARPNLDIVADFYSPDFVRLAQTVRNEVAGANAPAADLSELKRMAREKLADNKAAEAPYDLN